MKDGQYDFEFVALDKVRRGTLRVRGNLVDGNDDIHAIGGQLSRAGANVLASFDVAWRDRRPADDRAGYTVKMFGTGTDTEFSVVGLGPLGLIVEFRGMWREALGRADEPPESRPARADSA